MNCTLCGSETKLFFSLKSTNYYQCNSCKGISLDPSLFPSPSEEKDRYLLHNNDKNDPGYRKFVFPIVKEVLKTKTSNNSGLDFGSGPTPIITMMLQQEGYNIKAYDPFFLPQPEALSRLYHYIVCCEVMEHFHNPAKEFKLLFDLLHYGGHLYCKTLLYKESVNFGSWWYKNDKTHVFFYTTATLFWIKEYFGFRTVEIKDGIIIYMK